MDYDVFKGYQAADKDHQSAYATHQTAKDHYRECIGESSVEDALKCYEVAYNTDREQERAEEDLDAQREMANWAEGMLWATVFIGSVTAAVTAFGVWFVYKTLGATKETLRTTQDMALDQRRIGEAQTRAYISVNPIFEDFDAETPSLKFKWENVGQTPAKDFQLVYELQIVPYGLSVKSFFKNRKFTPKSDVGKGQSGKLIIEAKKNVPENWFQLLVKNEISLQATGIMIFRDVFGRRKYTTFRYITVRRDDETVAVIPSPKGNKSN